MIKEAVYMHLIGDKPNDWQRVEDQINEYLTPFNTRLSTQFMSWSDYQTMYSLVLTSGDQVDLIFTAPWCYMYTEAAKGSFYELTDEFVEAYMPLSKQHQAPLSWDETALAGKCPPTWPRLRARLWPSARTWLRSTASRS